MGCDTAPGSHSKDGMGESGGRGRNDAENKVGDCVM